MSRGPAGATFAGLARGKPTLVGIDSDGCVFDSMTVKQVGCFHPEILRAWNLRPIEPVLRETAEFVNLHSRWRGSNRFPALWRTFDLLARRPEAHVPEVVLPDTRALKAFIDSGRPLSQAGLAAEVARTGDPDLAQVLDWSRAVNTAVERTVTDMPPFPGVREALAYMGTESELIVVSQTPEEALVREWRAQGLDRWVSAMAGPEQGTKCEHLVRACEGRWAPERVLLIGDAPGDLAAARDAGVCFYPIEPGNESTCWAHLAAGVHERFVQGRYRGPDEEERIERFLARLPETPPWEQQPGT